MERSIALTSTAEANGKVRIKTKDFGTVFKGNEQDTLHKYEMTDGQIKSLKAFLGIKASAASNSKRAATAEAPVKERGTAAKSATAAPELTTKKQKFSYALGMSIGTQVDGNLKKQSVEVDPNLVSQGMQDTLSGVKPLLTQEEAQAVLTEAQNEVRKEHREKEEAFLAANKSKEGVVTLPDGLQYKILTAGTGPKPAASDSVVCNYRGTLINGTEFDSSYKRGQAATFGVSQVIKGWTEALELMPVGSKWQLFIPSSLAYGERGAGPQIGPDATLIFEVELLSIAGTQTGAAAAASAQVGAETSESLTLQAASDSGLVEYSFTGTGGSSGDAVRLKLRKTSKAQGSLTVSIPAGTILRSSNPSAQSMVVSRVSGVDMGGGRIQPTSRIVLESNSDVGLILFAFCAELEKNNPSSSTTFSLEKPDPMLACITSEGKSLSVAGEQAAVWMYTNHATYEHVNRKFPVARADWSAAEAVVEHCRMGEATKEHPNKSVKPEEKK